MKIFVQGSEIRTRGLLSPPCDVKEYAFNIDRLLNRDDLEFSRKHRPLPYNIAVHVSDLDYRPENPGPCLNRHPFREHHLDI